MDQMQAHPDYEDGQEQAERRIWGDAHAGIQWAAEHFPGDAVCAEREDRGHADNNGYAEHEKKEAPEPGEGSPEVDEAAKGLHAVTIAACRCLVKE